MRNILLARVDDRLIHGEVVTSFIPYYKSNCVIIVDDGVVNDKFNTRVLQMVCPKGVKLEIYGVEDGIKAICKDNDLAEQIIVLTRTPITFEQLINGGCDIKAVNIGGMATRGERKPFIRNCAATDEEVSSMKRMREKGIDVYYRLVAEQERIELKDKLS